MNLFQIKEGNTKCKRMRFEERQSDTRGSRGIKAGGERECALGYINITWTVFAGGRWGSSTMQRSHVQQHFVQQWRIDFQCLFTSGTPGFVSWETESGLMWKRLAALSDPDSTLTASLSYSCCRCSHLTLCRRPADARWAAKILSLDGRMMFKKTNSHFLKAEYLLKVSPKLILNQSLHYSLIKLYFVLLFWIIVIFKKIHKVNFFSPLNWSE